MEKVLINLLSRKDFQFYDGEWHFSWCDRRRTTLTTLLGPDIKAVTWPKDHDSGGNWLPHNTTISLIWMLWTSFVHFEQIYNVVKYSLDYLRQYAWWNWSNIFHWSMMFRSASGEKWVARLRVVDQSKMTWWQIFQVRQIGKQWNERPWVEHLPPRDSAP